MAKFDVDFHLDQEHLLTLLRPALKFLGVYIQMREIEGEAYWELRSDRSPDACSHVGGSLVDVGRLLAIYLEGPAGAGSSQLVILPDAAGEAAILARRLRMNLPEPLRPSPPLSKREIAMRRYLIRRGRRPK